MNSFVQKISDLLNMRSAARNAMKSTGPKTDAGKNFRLPTTSLGKESDFDAQTART
jgi:hypothetical protein